MTVPITTSTATFAGIVDGVPLTCNFPVQATTHLEVTYGADVVATLGVDYTVTLMPPLYATAEIVPLAGFAVTSGGTINAQRKVPLLQTLAIPPLATIYTSRLEQGLDYLTFIVTYLRDILGRSLTFRRTDSAASIGPLPSETDRASKFLAFDAAGKPVAAAGATSTGTPLSAFGIAWNALADIAAAQTYLSVYSKAAIDAFVAALIPKSIFTTRGDYLRGGVGGVPERAAKPTTDYVLGSDGTDIVGLARFGVIRVQEFLANGTYTPHAKAIYSLVRQVGGGGGGGGTGGTTGPTGATGGTTSLNSVTAIGGTGGTGRNGAGTVGIGGAGGTGGAGTATTRITGGDGSDGFIGLGPGYGGGTPWGGTTFKQGIGNTGRAGTANTGAGGGGSGSPGSTEGAGGGGGGEYVEHIIAAPVGPYAVTVGAGGAGGIGTGANAQTGGAGGSGRVTVLEFCLS